MPAMTARRMLPTLAFAVLLLGGCGGTKAYQAYVDAFVGQSAGQLYAVWGAPERSAPIPGGGSAVSFVTNVDNTVRWGLQYCETTFILDAQGIARQASFRGDACYH
jgi:hypothetical protein